MDSNLKMVKKNQMPPRREVYSVPDSIASTVVCVKASYYVGDKTGEKVISRSYDDHISSKYGMHVFIRSIGICVVNSKGEEVLTGILAARIEKDVIIFNRNNLWGIADYDGNIIREPFAQCIGAFDEQGRAVVSICKNKLYNYTYWGAINKKGEYLIQPKFSELLIRGKNLIVKFGEVFGCIDMQENVIIPFEYRRMKVDKEVILYHTNNSPDEYCVIKI